MSDSPPSLFCALAAWAESCGARDIAQTPGKAWIGMLEISRTDDPAEDDVLEVAIHCHSDSIVVGDSRIPLAPFTFRVMSRRRLAVALISPQDATLVGFVTQELFDLFAETPP